MEQEERIIEGDVGEGEACALVTGEEEAQDGTPSCTEAGSEMERRHKEDSGTRLREVFCIKSEALSLGEAGDLCWWWRDTAATSHDPRRPKTLVDARAPCVKLSTTRCMLPIVFAAALNGKSACPSRVEDDHNMKCNEASGVGVRQPEEEMDVEAISPSGPPIGTATSFWSQQIWPLDGR